MIRNQDWLYKSALNLDQTALPAIWKQARQEQTVFLDLSKNNFTTFPLPDIPLPHVKVLELSYNRRSIKELQIDAKTFPNLEYLFVYESQIQEIRLVGKFEKLYEINAAKNRLTLLSGLEQAANFPNLECLFLYGNPLVNFPKEIFDRRDKNAWESVKSFLQESNKGTVINDRAKLIIIGNGRVGKTSLYNVLKKGKYNPNEKFTHGIVLGSLSKKELSEVEAETLRLQVWDFGGQHIFYALHQFFLSENAIYILAWTNFENVRNKPKEKEQPIDEKWRTEEYWLENIKHVGKGSPTLVVQTHADVPANKKIKPFEGYDIYAQIDFSAAKKLGLDSLKYHLAQILNTRIEGFNKKEPITYENVIKEIEALKAKGVVEISKEKFFELCHKKDEKGRSIDKGNEMPLLDLLRVRGIVLYYEDEQMKDTIYINPEAIVEQVYLLINNRLEAQAGRFDEPYIEAFLLQKKEKKAYFKSLEKFSLADYEDRKKRREFIALLLKFGLVFRIYDKEDKDREIYIAPQYLPKEIENKEARTLFQDTFEELKLSYIFAFPRYIPDNVVVNFWSKYGPFSSEVIYRTGIYFKKENRKFIVVFKEHNQDGEIINQIQVYSHHQEADYTLLAEICQTLLDLSHNAYAEISHHQNDFVCYQTLCEAIENTPTIRSEQGNWVATSSFDFLFPNAAKKRDSQKPKISQKEKEGMEKAISILLEKREAFMAEMVKTDSSSKKFELNCDIKAIDAEVAQYRDRLDNSQIVPH
ncbi:COR domain-containing protein [Hugenholtzia roseola]|uniref:COR domain-containing protein n=1 Tax=Hugenholtzia roseola TaxID=1002 RepID=UPI000421BD92|nr:COR domain-containing protein [Hugenholtzia roseola]